MKITLIHCYSDHNRGDTGIIYSIHDLIKKIEPDATVVGMSVFSSRDVRFHEDHKHTKTLIKDILPSFFPEPGIITQQDKKPLGYLKLANFIRYLTINLIIFITGSKKLAKILFTSDEHDAFQNFITSDKIISKGGSFLYSFKGWNGALFFARMISPFYLAKRFGVPTYIYSQSIGPLETVSSRILFSLIKDKIKRIYLRERKCLEYINYPLNNAEIIFDAAFYLEYVNESLPFHVSEKKKVAITARPHKFTSGNNKLKFENYLNSLIAVIRGAIADGHLIYLVPQVTGPSLGEDDRVALREIARKFENDPNVIYIDHDFNPRQLKKLYSLMDMVIGTRLHSTIFSLGAYVPSINISYHGTKSMGTMEEIGMKEFVVEINEITEAKILRIYENTKNNLQNIRRELQSKSTGINSTLESSMRDILLNH